MRKRLVYILISVAFFGLLTLTSCSDENKNQITETTITVDMLPEQARDFIKQFYSDTSVSRIEKDDEDGVTIYKVDFANGHEAVFGSDGEWQQLEAPDGKTIPSGIVLSSITEYLGEYYSGYGINEINRTGYGFKLELTPGGLSLMFGPEGSYVGPVSDN